MKLPAVTRSLRFRLSGLTSALVFSVAGLALAGIYFVTLQAIQSLTVTARLPLEPVVVDGARVVFPFTEVETRTFESVVREALLNKLAVWVIAIMFGLFVLSLIVGWLVANRTLRPIDQITSVAQEIEATDLSRRISLDGPADELKRMADTFDAMLDRLSGSFQSQQRFVAHTSHDLRTPLAVIRSNLEVTADDPGATVEDWRKTGEIVERAAGRISVMVDDLLAIARLELAGAALMPVELDRLVTQLVSGMTATAAAGGVDLSADVPPTPVTATVDADLIRRALANLVENAIRETPTGGHVRVAVRVEDAWVCLGVIDDGPGVEPAFVTEGEDGHGGMGLGIVRQIVAMHAGHLSAIERPSGGMIVSIAFPGPDGSEPGLMPDSGLLELYR